MRPAETESFLDQFKKSKAEIERLKATVPHIFPAWQNLKNAEDEFERARIKLEIARQQWEKT